MEELRDIHSLGNTIIMVTHNPALTTYATRVINMLDGEIDTDVKTVADRDLPKPGDPERIAVRILPRKTPEPKPITPIAAKDKKPSVIARRTKSDEAIQPSPPPEKPTKTISIKVTKEPAKPKDALSRPSGRSPQKSPTKKSSVIARSAATKQSSKKPLAKKPTTKKPTTKRSKT